MKTNIFVLFFLSSFFLSSQEKEQDVYEKYYEDQFYFGIQYNSLLNTKHGIDNIGVPYSFEAGFIKDIPFNKKRNIGIGLGFGYSYDILRPNISISSGENNNYNVNINTKLGGSKYLSHNVEFPFEFRWRTSTAKTYNFWRIYTGASFIYSFKNKTEISSGNNTTTFTDINIFNTNNYTLYTSIGYGTWNFHLKYYLKSPFKNSITTTNGNTLEFNQLKIGVMFYLL